MSSAVVAPLLMASCTRSAMSFRSLIVFPPFPDLPYTSGVPRQRLPPLSPVSAREMETKIRIALSPPEDYSSLESV
jgi:hypothetical protein